MDEVLDKMQKLGVRGFTGWEELHGCGTQGEPHLGTNAWPTMNSAFISVMEDEQCTEVMDLARQIDAENPKLGLRAFWWSVGGTL